MGQRALLVDADRQRSSRFWAQTRSPLRLPRPDSTPLYGEAFARQIATIASSYDDVVIDTGAADERDIIGYFVASGYSPDQRYESGSILVTANLPFEEGTEVFGSERRATGGEVKWGELTPGQGAPRKIKPGKGTCLFQAGSQMPPTPLHEDSLPVSYFSRNMVT